MGLVVLIRISVRIRVRVRVRIQLEVVVWFGSFGLVWNDDVCIRRSGSAHQLDSDILQLYRKM